MAKNELETIIIMLEHKDYLSSLNKARKKRNQQLDPRYLVLLLAAIVAVGIIVFGVKAVKKPRAEDIPPHFRQTSNFKQTISMNKKPPSSAAM